MTKHIHILNYIIKRVFIFLVTNAILVFIITTFNKTHIQKSDFPFTINKTASTNIIKILIHTEKLKKYDNIYQHVSYIPFPDTRIIALRKFLQDHKSPMADYAAHIVKNADKYNQDWRIIVAISGVESVFGRIIRPNSYNAWGWRGGPGGDFSKFASWPDAITYITKRFTLGYGQNPNPYDIYKTYCPPCTQAWPNGVKRYMQELTIYRQQINNNLKRQYLKANN